MKRAAIGARLRRLDWPALEASLASTGYARTGPILTPGECRRLALLYDDDRLFRKRIDMERHRFGIGAYKYFASPLPSPVQELRARLYPPLASIANAWMRGLRSRERFPADLRGFLSRCRRAGQTKPTPLILYYEAGGYKCLHQDL